MKLLLLAFLIVMWFLFTVILACSIVGLLLLLPVQNNTGYHMEMTDSRRSSWIMIGRTLTTKFIEKI